jgi:hypothetical protein
MTFIARIARYLPISEYRRLDIVAGSVDRAYRRDIASARKDRKDRDAIESLEGMHREELALINEEQSVILSNELTARAHRLNVSVPRVWDQFNQETPFWERGHRTGSYYLTELGIKAVRTEIRDEEKWRIERRSRWITWISVLTGLIGALTGLLAILLSKP